MGVIGKVQPSDVCIDSNEIVFLLNTENYLISRKKSCRQNFFKKISNFCSRVFFKSKQSYN